MTREEKRREYLRAWRERRSKNPEAMARLAAYMRRYRKEKPEIVKLSQRRSYRKAYAAIKKEVFQHYGCKCACCGEATLEFLGIDHVNGGGNKHRRETLRSYCNNVYLWLKKNDYPEGFQLLCHNCNMAKGLYGTCPHKGGLP